MFRSQQLPTHRGRRRRINYEIVSVPLLLTALSGCFIYLIVYLPTPRTQLRSFVVEGNQQRAANARSPKHDGRDSNPKAYEQITAAASTAHREDGAFRSARSLGAPSASTSPCDSACRSMELELNRQAANGRDFCVRQYWNGSASVPPYLTPLEIECHTGVQVYIHNTDLSSTLLPPHPSVYCLRQGDGSEARENVILYGYAAGDDKVSRILREERRWESDIQRAIARVFRVARSMRWSETPKEELYLVDIGGHVGAHSLCASQLGYSAIVFEPLRENEVAIRSSVCENKLLDRVTLVPKGLGETAQICQIISETRNIGDGITRCNTPSPPPPPYTTRGNFEMVTLDEALYCPYKHSRRRIAAIKLDVESQESYVVQGGRRFFEDVQAPLIVYENGGMTLDKRKKVLGYFLDLGYHYTCADALKKTGPVEVYNDYVESILHCWDLLLYHGEFVGGSTKEGQGKYLMEGL